MAKYSEDFKLSIIKQMMPPQNKTVSILSKKWYRRTNTLQVETRSESQRYCNY